MSELNLPKSIVYCEKRQQRNSKKIRTFTRRQHRGLAIVWLGNQIQKLNDRSFLVNSQSNLSVYLVQRKSSRWYCDCLDYLEKNKPCKHIFAVLYARRLKNILASNARAITDLDGGTE